MKISLKFLDLEVQIVGASPSITHEGRVDAPFNNQLPVHPSTGLSDIVDAADGTELLLAWFHLHNHQHRGDFVQHTVASNLQCQLALKNSIRL